MTNEDLKTFVEDVKAVVPQMIQEWNTKKLPAWEAIQEESFAAQFEKITSKQRTQEKTKTIGKILDKMFYRLMEKKNPKFTCAEVNGADWVYDQTKGESKITLADGQNWTGNGYAKTGWHLLFRFETDDNGVITKSFVMLINLSECKSKWGAPSDKSNFSNLKLLSEDISKCIPIIGTLTTNTPKGKYSKYLTPIMA